MGRGPEARYITSQNTVRRVHRFSQIGLGSIIIAVLLLASDEWVGIEILVLY